MFFHRLSIFSPSPACLLPSQQSNVRHVLCTPPCLICNLRLDTLRITSPCRAPYNLQDQSSAAPVCHTNNLLRVWCQNEDVVGLRLPPCTILFVCSRLPQESRRWQHVHKNSRSRIACPAHETSKISRKQLHLRGADGHLPLISSRLAAAARHCPRQMAISAPVALAFFGPSLAHGNGTSLCILASTSAFSLPQLGQNVRYVRFTRREVPSQSLEAPLSMMCITFVESVLVARYYWALDFCPLTSFCWVSLQKFTPKGTIDGCRG